MPDRAGQPPPDCSPDDNRAAEQEESDSVSPQGWVELRQAERATSTVLVPTMIGMLLDDPAIDALGKKITFATSAEQQAKDWAETQKAIFDGKILLTLWADNQLIAAGKKIKEYDPPPGIGYLAGIENAKI
mgnify:CR=1 FL=1